MLTKGSPSCDSKVIRFFVFLSLNVMKYHSRKIILTQRAKRPNDFTFKFVAVLNLGPVRLYGDSDGEIQDFPYGRGRQPEKWRGANILFWPFFPKTGWKWKNGGERRSASLASSFHPPMYTMAICLRYTGCHRTRKSINALFLNCWEKSA